MALTMKVVDQHAEVTRYTGEDSLVEIPERYKGVPVTVIREGAFTGARFLENVIVPRSLERIGPFAFANCRRLQRVGVKGEDPLGDNAERVSCLLPVKQVGPRAFACSGIRLVLFSAEKVSIGCSAFERCRQLEMVVMLGAKEADFGRRAFAQSSIRLFRGRKLRMSSLPERAFERCKELIQVSLADLDGVGERCFYHCSKLERLELGGLLVRVGLDAFTGCDALKKIPAFEETCDDEPLENEKIIFSEGESVRTQMGAKGAMRWDDTWLECNDIECDDIECDEDLEAFDEPLFEPRYRWDEAAAGRPLFHLEVAMADGQSLLPNELSGIWTGEEDGVRFRVKAPYAHKDCKIMCADEDELCYYRPIMKYTQSKKIATTVLGKQEGSRYAVYELVPEMGECWDNEVARDFFGEIVKRLQMPTPGTKTELERVSFVDSMVELDAMYEICRDTLPKWVEWAWRKNKRQSTDYSDSDARQHAKRALKLLMNIEWRPKMGVVPDVVTARQILDAEFHGLEAVKDRIVEVVAQIRRTGVLPKWGILLAGPAGTGKTTIAKAVAKLLDMPLIQMDMSSLGDEAETISGSSRIYHNASPGLLLSAMFENRSSTAVLLANELDNTPKKGYSAVNTLLTVLDKTGFYENFLEEIVPTDNIFCIGTCNDINKLSRPLRDRFLVIEVPPYSREEKQVIWRDFVLPRALAGANIGSKQLTVTEEAAQLLVNGYAVLPGVRDLEQSAERLVGNYCRNADGVAGFTREYDTEDVKALFGPIKALNRHIAHVPGQVNSAFYFEGVAHFFLVEASVMPGTGQFKAIGPMSDLQKEYAKVAYTCVRNTTGMDLSALDVEIFIPHTIPVTTQNHVGLACYAAICSKLFNTNLALRDTCFIGGCDMNGALYFDEYDIGPLLRAMHDREVSVVYAPMGTNCLLEGNVSQNDAVAIIEAPDAATLFSIAAAQGKMQG